MRKLIIGLALASTAAMAAPASAQYQDRYGNDQYRNRGYDRNYGYGQSQQFEQQLGQLRQRIQRVSQRGVVSRNEAFRLQRQLQQIERLYDQYARNGLNRNEQYDLQRRIENLRAQVREDRQDGRRYQTLERGYQDDGYYQGDSRVRDRDYDYRRDDRRDRNDDD